MLKSNVLTDVNEVPKFQEAHSVNGDTEVQIFLPTNANKWHGSNTITKCNPSPFNTYPYHAIILGL